VDKPERIDSAVQDMIKEAFLGALKDDHNFRNEVIDVIASTYQYDDQFLRAVRKAIREGLY
jgi:hypothetical protein